jgi:hypothetical protein
MIKEGSGQLLTPPRLITFLTSLRGTIIDLAFAIEVIANRLKECRVAPKLDFSLDH